MLFLSWNFRFSSQNPKRYTFSGIRAHNYFHWPGLGRGTGFSVPNASPATVDHGLFHPVLSDTSPPPPGRVPLSTSITTSMLASSWQVVEVTPKPSFLTPLKIAPASLARRKLRPKLSNGS